MSCDECDNLAVFLDLMQSNGIGKLNPDPVKKFDKRTGPHKTFGALLQHVHDTCHVERSAAHFAESCEALLHAPAHHGISAPSDRSSAKGGLDPPLQPPTNAVLSLPRHLNDGTPYLSPSQVRTYLTCPQMYAFHYIANLPDDAVTIDMVFGSAVHAALAAALREQMVGTMPTEGEVRLVGEGQMSSMLKDPENANARKGLDEVSREELIREAGAATLLAWSDLRRRGFVPDLVESRVMQHFDGYVNMGFLDAHGHLPNGESVLIDFKTTDRTPAGEKASRIHQYQVIVYDEALDQAGIATDRAWVMYIIRTMEPKVFVADVIVDERAVAWARKLTEHVKERILAKDFVGNPIGAGFMCAPTRCAYWSRCTYAPKHEEATA